MTTTQTRPSTPITALMIAVTLVTRLFCLSPTPSGSVFAICCKMFFISLSFLFLIAIDPCFVIPPDLGAEPSGFGMVSRLVS